MPSNDMPTRAGDFVDSFTYRKQSFKLLDFTWIFNDPIKYGEFNKSTHYPHKQLT